MNFGISSRILKRYLQIRGSRVSFSVDERQFRWMLQLRSFQPDDMIQLSYQSPSDFLAAITYLAWRDLVANNQANKDNEVFISQLEERVEELKEEYSERIGSMTYYVPEGLFEDEDKEQV